MVDIALIIVVQSIAAYYYGLFICNGYASQKINDVKFILLSYTRMGAPYKKIPAVKQRAMKIHKV